MELWKTLRIMLRAKIQGEFILFIVLEGSVGPQLLLTVGLTEGRVPEAVPVERLSGLHGLPQLRR